MDLRNQSSGLKGIKKWIEEAQVVYLRDQSSVFERQRRDLRDQSSVFERPNSGLKIQK